MTSHRRTDSPAPSLTVSARAAAAFITSSSAPQDSKPSPPSPARLVSIDALRGIDMFWIVGGGEVFAALVKVWSNCFTQRLHDQLEHVHWEGVHFEDLIYPLFLFIIGIVLPFSLVRRQERDQSRGRLYLHYLTRSRGPHLHSY